jgi:hypothetical protein
MRAVAISKTSPTRQSWSWADRVSSEEAAWRAGGRRRINGVRKLRARVRRLAMAKALMADGLGVESRRRLAEQFGVSPRTVNNDLCAILRSTGRTPTLPRQRAQEVIMAKRLTVRLSGELHDRLQRKADALGLVASDILRQALEAYLIDNPRANHSTLSRKTDQSASPCDHVCAQTILALLPGELRTDLLAKAALLAMPPEKLIAYVVIAQLSPVCKRPQSSKAMPPVANTPTVPGAAQPASTFPAPSRG